MGRVVAGGGEVQPTCDRCVHAVPHGEVHLGVALHLKHIIQGFKHLAGLAHVGVGQGALAEEESAAADEKAVRELERSPTGQAYAVARANFEKVMIKVNQLIGEGIEKGATSGIITLG